jgi:hypothetical protein
MTLDALNDKKLRSQISLSVVLLVASIIGLAGMIDRIDVSELSTFRVELSVH